MWFLQPRRENVDKKLEVFSLKSGIYIQNFKKWKFLLKVILLGHVESSLNNPVVKLLTKPQKFFIQGPKKVY